MDRILRCTYAYGESKKDSKKGRYKLLMKKRVRISHQFAFIGALILLSIHGVRNHRKAWSTAQAQVLYRLRDLLTCQLFELIGTFIHVVTPAEEDAASGNPLRKIQPLVDHIKAKCFEFYQPRKVCIDERMVKSKARCHFKQYMRNKPTKWGFKQWVLADMTGYTVDFDIYTGKSADKSDSGLISLSLHLRATSSMWTIFTQVPICLSTYLTTELLQQEHSVPIGVVYRLK